jgi:lipopolysaccharide transport system permease protein
MAQSSESLVNQQHILGKIYFPRIIFPMTPVLARIVDLGISMIIVVCVLLYYRVNPSINILYLPFFLLLMVCISAGVGFWLSSMAIRFRDVKYAMQFAVRLLMYSAPIVYSASSIPENYRMFYSINPLVAVIEGFRACLLGYSIPWQFIWPGTITAFLLLISGAFYFKRMEKVFVDVI